MKKILFLSICLMLFLSGCGTYAGEGAGVGGYAGSILGSAIGGIIGGPRGSDVGTIIGMAGGAAVGASVGAAADQKMAADNQQYANGGYDQSSNSDYSTGRGSYNQNNSGYSQNSSDRYAQNSNSGYGSNDNYTPGDDRINMYNDDSYSGNYSAVVPKTYTPEVNQTPGYSFKLNPAIEIVNLRFVDSNRDKSINAGEECKVIFEVMNRSNSILYDVQPIVVESTGNKHIFVSPSIHVESLQPGTGVRYTAMVKADNRLKDGSAIFRISAIQGNGQITSKINELAIPTVSR